MDVESVGGGVERFVPNGCEVGDDLLEAWYGGSKNGCQRGGDELGVFPVVEVGGEKDGNGRRERRR